MVAYNPDALCPLSGASLPARVSIYSDDHPPAHFHIEGRGFRAIVEIETLAVRVGDVRRAGDAMAWARENIDLLQAVWRRLNRIG